MKPRPDQGRKTGLDLVKNTAATNKLLPKGRKRGVHKKSYAIMCYLLLASLDHDHPIASKVLGARYPSTCIPGRRYTEQVMLKLWNGRCDSVSICVHTPQGQRRRNEVGHPRSERCMPDFCSTPASAATRGEVHMKICEQARARPASFYASLVV